METLFVTGGKDVLADATDVDKLRAEIAKSHNHGNQPAVMHIEDYDHLDFTLADDANVLIYDKIIHHLGKHSHLY